MNQQQKDESIRHRITTCKYFTGVSNTTCEKGIDYDAVCKHEEGKMAAWPCLPWGKHLPCKMREYPTLQEAQAEEDEVENLVKNVELARAAVVADASKKVQIEPGYTLTYDEDQTYAVLHKRISIACHGRIACPICKKGVLEYDMHHNGHISAKCTVDGCIKWME